jgi:hypothetical protein
VDILADRRIAAFAQDQAGGDDTHLLIKADYARMQRRPASRMVPVLGERVRFLARVASVAGLGAWCRVGRDRHPAALSASTTGIVTFFDALENRDPARLQAQALLLIPVCTENVVRVDDVMESPKLAQ